MKHWQTALVAGDEHAARECAAGGRTNRIPAAHPPPHHSAQAASVVVVEGSPWRCDTLENLRISHLLRFREKKTNK